MNPATDEKVDLEQELLMTKSLPTYRLSQKLGRRAPKGKLAKMTARRIFFMLLAVTLLALGSVSATIGPGEILPRAASAISKAQRQFHDIFNNEGPATLLSHSASTVQSDIHGSTEPSPEIAYQKEVDAPKNLVELAKRQTGPGNDTSTGPTSSPTSSSTTSSSSSSSSSISSSSQTTTTSSTSSVPTTTSPTSTPTPTPPPTSTTTTTSSTSSPSTSSSPTSSTSASSTTKVSSSPTTSAPSQSITSINIFTSTDNGGAVVTVTDLTIVPAPVAEQTGSDSSQTGSPSLQQNAAVTRSPAIGVILSALGMAALLAL